MKNKRISKKELEWFSAKISPRDREILNTLLKCRYLSTAQIRRLYFSEHSTELAALRATNRTLKKLREYGLAEPLERRIGGINAGSDALIWHLSDPGLRLLNLDNTESASRKRYDEPSLQFLRHTLAISETYVQLSEICHNHNLKLIKAEPEPLCWRNYIGRSGKTITLKPDTYAVIRNGGYEDSYFIEVDLATESPNRILSKCVRYADYYQKGVEQKQSGVFPLVVWIVPNESRKGSLRRSISECKGLRPQEIFTVILPDELEKMILEGAGAL
ncbi:MAG: replication-relaxation family protein [Oscillospiraceae bacterium]|nr:replication-relaxation family protein [Oscillospiraceae bacterium]